MAVNELSDLRADGTRLGQTAADKISFHGAAPVAQAAFVASAGSVGSTATVAVTSGHVFANSSAAAQLFTIVEAMRVALITHGILAAS